MDIFDFLALLRLSLKSVITVYGSPKTDIIKCIIDNNVMYITLYAFCITLAIIIIIIRNKSKKRRYIDWKNDTFNIKFDNLWESNISGFVYDINGTLVGEFEIDRDGDFLFWDGNDVNGNPAAKGVYIYQLKGEKKTFSGTVVLAR